MNDLKDDEFIGRNMGRTILWLVALLLVIPVVNASDQHTHLTQEGTAWFDCQDSWASIHDEQGVELENSSDFTRALDSQNHTLYFEDASKCQWVMPVTDELPNSLPAPYEEFPSQKTNECSQPYNSQTACTSELVSGDLINDSEDVFAIDVLSGQFLKLGLEASSSAIDVEIYFQNDSESEKLDFEISLPLNTSIGQSNILNIPVTGDGRILVSVTSPSPNTYWMISYELYSTTNNLQLVDLENISGMGEVPFMLEIGRDESLIVTSSSSVVDGTDVKVSYRYAYSETSYSNWTNASVGDRIHSIESIDHIELFWNCDCEWSSSMIKESHFDADWGRDAPGFRPLSPTSDNSSYPLIEMDGGALDGELTLHMDDYQDILRVETTGWNESIHLVDVIVEGDIYDLQVSIMNIDQETWDILDQVSATYSMDKIRLSLDVGLGTHFIKIQHLNGSDALDVNGESVQWKIRVETAVIEEGDEPWFPASEAVKDAANVFYWMIGALLILPFIIFYLNLNNTRKFAEEFARKKDRLKWLSKKLDEGNFSPSDLSKALRSVSTLDWEEALAVWGEPQVRHFTTGIDMAVWSLDERISESDAWPILIGLRPQDCEWSVAALKFEANEGGEWSVEKVEPKLLHRSNEIFLDTIHDNSRVFIRVDLNGNAKSTDIYLSGMVDGEPMAAKPANTVYRILDSEE